MFKIGVAAEITNPKLFEPFYLSCSIYTSDIVWENLNHIFIPNSELDFYDYELTDFIRIGDKVKLISTDSNSYGKSEIMVIKSIESMGLADGTTGIRLKFIEKFVYKYHNGDMVYLYGSRFGGGWEVYRDQTTSPEYYTCSGDLMTPNNFDIGRIDANAQVFKEGGNNSYYSLFYQRLKLLEIGKYRLGYWGKLEGTAGSVVPYYSSDMNYNRYSLGDFTAVDSSGQMTSTTTWTEFSDVVDYSATSITLEEPYTYYLFKITNPATGYMNAYISDIFLEHAIGTDDEDNGVYTFDEVPANGVTFSTDVLLNNFGSGDFLSIKKHTVNMTFNNVSKDFYKQLDILLQWQNKGNYLNLHIDEKYRDQYPAYLKGIMSIDRVSKETWNPDNVSFILNFQEV